MKYTVKKGTEIITGNGICIEANDDVIVLLEENGFHVLNKEKYTILEVLPEHIGQQLLFQTQHFMEISTDSLNQLVQQNPIKFLEIYSNQNFQVSQNNRYSNTRKFKVDYPSALFFKEEKNKINTPPPTLFFPNPRIKTMQLQMGGLKKKAQLSKLNHSKKQAQLDSLKSLFFTSENLTQREAIYQKIKQLEMTKLSVFDPTKIQELQAKLSEFQKADSNKLMAGNFKSSNLQDGDKNTKTTLTGIITFIILN